MRWIHSSDGPVSPTSGNTKRSAQACRRCYGGCLRILLTNECCDGKVLFSKITSGSDMQPDVCVCDCDALLYFSRVQQSLLSPNVSICTVGS